MEEIEHKRNMRKIMKKIVTSDMLLKKRKEKGAIP